MSALGKDENLSRIWGLRVDARVVLGLFWTWLKATLHFLKIEQANLNEAEAAACCAFTPCAVRTGPLNNAGNDHVLFWR